MRHVLRPGAVGACPRLRAYGLAVAVAGCLMADPASAALGPQLISEFDPATARVAVAPARRLTMAIAAPAIRPLRLAQVWGRQRPRVSRGFFGGGSDTPIFRPKMSAAPTAMRVKRLAPAFAPRNPSGVWITGFGPSGDTAYPSNTPPGLRPAYSVAPIHALRTVCVRLCDGYYWPISSNSSQSRLSRDAETCESSCGSPARLYLQQDLGSDVAGMRDLSGKPYKKLDTAFLYRKKYDPACRCKAEPWASTEASRHEEYALQQGSGADSGESTGSYEVIAGDYAPERAQELETASILDAAAVDAIEAANESTGGPARRRVFPDRIAVATSASPATKSITVRSAAGTKVFRPRPRKTVQNLGQPYVLGRKTVRVVSP